jgi:hypothetical protein
MEELNAAASLTWMRFPFRVENYAEDFLALVKKGDARSPDRDAPRVVHRAIQRINDPEIVRFRPEPAAFLGEDGVAGELLADHAQDDFLGFLVHGELHVATLGPVHADVAAAPLQEQPARLARGAYCGVEHWTPPFSSCEETQGHKYSVSEVDAKF